ncbi:MAG: permease-like cell division protein FtsX [Clostridium sp.]|uniref:permease-like cell division protein FtsX n=1 Tax=Clostridium sp. TaxID=1506 RepID=UPI002A8D9994|nr:permease-like cell division protein FtsX [Clostridium sp.]MDY5099148.1 permease-like cell division protein FtsX [Clostridium sp.]
MKTNTVKHFFVDALKSLKRNKTISIASALTVSATLFIFGVFVLIAVTVNNQVKIIEDMVEVEVFLTNEVTISEQRDIEATLKDLSGVEDVIYKSKLEALEDFKEQMKGNEVILSGYGSDNNPLPSSFVVKISSPEVAESITSAVENMPGYEPGEGQTDIIDKIIKVSSTIKVVGVIIFVIFIGVSLFLISNTIKLTVFSRRREVGIMKFVGATDWFIRWPFIIEGVIIGVIGALIANGVLSIGYNILYTNITQSMIGATPLVAPSYVYTVILLEFILAGIIVGALGSFVSLRKFLEV